MLARELFQCWSGDLHGLSHRQRDERKWESTLPSLWRRQGRRRNRTDFL
jgi:hypothetical protein